MDKWVNLKKNVSKLPDLRIIERWERNEHGQWERTQIYDGEVLEYTTDTEPYITITPEQVANDWSAYGDDDD